MLRRIVTLVCALALGAAAVLGFATGNLVHALRLGGPGTYWVLGAGIVALVASVVLAWREQLAHPAFGVACLALPQIAALASSVWTGRRLDRVLDGLVGDIVPRIVADGTSELLLPIVLADLFTVACAATIATGILARRSSDCSPDPRPPAKLVLALGGTWILVSIVFAERGPHVGLQYLLPVLVAAMVAIAVATRGEREVPTLVAFAGVFAVFLLERAIIERVRATAFGDLSREATPAIEQARLLASYLGVRNRARLELGVHIALGVVTSFAAYGLPRKTRAPLLTILVLIAAMSLREQRAFARRMEHVRTAFDVGVPLPSTSVTSGWFVSGGRFVVNSAGTLTEVVPPGEIEEAEEPVAEGEHFGPPPRFAKAVFADADLGCGALVSALQPKVRPRQSFALAAVHSRSEVPRPSLGDLEPLVGDRELVGLGFDIGRHYPRIDAIVSGDTIVLKLPGEADLTFTLAVDPDEVARAVAARRPEPLPKRDTVQLTVHASDSVRRLATALGILTVAFPMETKGEHRYFALRVE